MDAPDYCRQIESYLCRKNEGHLVRVVGPSFDMVSRWAADGIPLKIAFLGIDRYVERYYRKGPRRRPVRIDACEADVLDAFDEWRRVTGVTAAERSVLQPADDATADAVATDPGVSGDGPGRRSHGSLSQHLQRSLMRLTTARAADRILAAADSLIDAVSNELDRARASPSGLRGQARQALVARLADLDAQLLAVAKQSLSPADLDSLSRAADEELLPFRDRMTDERYAYVRALTIDRLIRERCGLPTLSLS